MENKIVYLCNGHVDCCRRTGCYITGGPCEHTVKEEFARNPRGSRVFEEMPDGTLFEVDTERREE